MKLANLKDLYVEQLRDLYSAEDQLVDALPEMAKSASHPELREAFETHLQETKRQKARLEQIFDRLDEKPSGETCEAMKGLIKEGKEMIKKKADEDVRDAGLITAAQRVEHYEMAGYGTVRTYADMLDRSEDVRLLDETLNEEKKADEKLNRIAMSVVNLEAARA
jgi:ferritin-like metal-binding protein YciE